MYLNVNAIRKKVEREDKIGKRKKREAGIEMRYQSLKGTLTECSQRLFAGSEALAFGYGGIAAVNRATGISPKTVSRGLAECQEIEAGILPTLPPQRSRRKGGGRKKLTEKYPELLQTLKIKAKGYGVSKQAFTCQAAARTGLQFTRQQKETGRGTTSRQKCPI